MDFKAVTKKWPIPPATPYEALRHTMDMHHDGPDDRIVLEATSNVYPLNPDGSVVRTGITLGDLRWLMKHLESRR